MSDLVAFLRARLDEDEVTARGAARTDDGHGGQWLPVYFGSGGFDARVDDHIARHDPLRVIREVEAMRAIVDAYEAVLKECATMLGDRRPRKYGEHDGLREAARYLAAIWRDHPDYDPEWAA